MVDFPRIGTLRELVRRSAERAKWEGRDHNSRGQLNFDLELKSVGQVRMANPAVNSATDCGPRHEQPDPGHTQQPGAQLHIFSLPLASSAFVTFPRVSRP